MERAIKIIDLPNERHHINIYFIGDTHIGNASANERALMKAVDIVKKNHEQNPYTYIIWMGDYCDFITHTGDRRFDPIELSKVYGVRQLRELPKAQADRFLKFIEPVKEYSMASIIGNHEDTYIKRNTNNIYEYIRDGLGNPIDMKRFGFLRITLRSTSGAKTQSNIDLVLRHGGGGYSGSTHGYPINKIIKVFEGQEGDLHVMGHIHHMATKMVPYIRLSSSGKTFMHGERWYGVNGAFLESYVEGETNYHESRGGSPIPVGMLKATLGMHRTKQRGKAIVNKIIKLEEVYL